MAEIVGGVFTRAAAVTVNVRDTERLTAWPSSTVTVITALPEEAGVMLSDPAADGDA
jgi:hypothetical protein